MVYKLYKSSLRKIGLQCFRYKSSRSFSTLLIQPNVPSGGETTFRKCLPKPALTVTLVPVSKQNIHRSTQLNGSKVIPFVLSDIGEGIVEVIVKEWFVQPGDRVSQFQPVCEVQSDKASATITSRYDGIVKKLHYNIDDVAKVGSPLLDVATDTVEPDTKKAPVVQGRVSNLQDTRREQDSEVFFSNKALATPAVRRIAKENNVNLSLVAGSGKSGRILKEDVLSFVESGSRVAVKERPEERRPEPVKTPVTEGGDRDRVEAITGFKKAMAKSMANAWTVPHFSYCDEVDAKELVDLKTDLSSLSKSVGTKITFMPFFMKAASLALAKYPILNSLVDENCEYVTFKKSHNIGVAMDTPNGLVVPNVKNVQELSVIEIARKVNFLQEKGLKGQLSVEDLSGGTFTLSNIGAIGGTYTKPILFTPQVVIGALGRIHVVPRFSKTGDVIEAHIFNMSWTADHRVVDGATLARFSNLWKLYLGNPKLLLNL